MPATHRLRYANAASTAGDEHPPKARLAFRVGIVGHRPNRLPDDDVGRARIRQRLGSVLAAVKAAVDVFRQEPDAAFYTDEPPLLRANSPLAEGADRVFAEAALDLGYALWCPMPFAQGDYEEDFAPATAHDANSLDRFRALLDRAANGPGLATFQLDGDRARESDAYGAAGRLVLNQSDLLVVVWDGGAAGGGGGTVDTLVEALGFHVPVLWIDAVAPYDWSLLSGPDDLKRLESGDSALPSWSTGVGDADELLLDETVASIVLGELRLPAAPPDEIGVSETHAHAHRYFLETRPPFNPFVQWKFFRDLIGLGRIGWQPLKVEPFVEQVRWGWPVGPGDVRGGAPQPAPVMAKVNAALREHYAWADKRADLYADAHRSASILTSLFAALAVFLALLPMGMGWWNHAHVGLERATIIAELLVLILIVSLGSLSHWRHWHPRWLEYRVLAELVRQLRLLLPLGGGRPAPRAPAHLITYGDPTRSWMTWQLRAVARAVDIPDIVVTQTYIGQCLDDLLDMADGPVQGQLGFHELSHQRSYLAHERLHALTSVLFWSTIVAVLGHFALTFIAPENPAPGRWLLVASAVAPAVGAALANINNQSEFARLAKRFRSMAEGFRSLIARITALRARQEQGSRPPDIAEVTRVAKAMTDMMVDENADWRVVVLDLPHAGG